MKTISIRELHIDTGRWVRRAQEREPIVITDRGRPVATLTAYAESHLRKALPDREAQIRKMRRIPVDSSEIVSDMRDRS
jgi:prevent-host-death family protein